MRQSSKWKCDIKMQVGMRIFSLFANITSRVLTTSFFFFLLKYFQLCVNIICHMYNHLACCQNLMWQKRTLLDDRYIVFCHIMNKIICIFNLSCPFHNLHEQRRDFGKFRNLVKWKKRHDKFKRNDY